MAQFFYGGNVAYDEGANVRNLADSINKSQQTAALSRQADAASKESLTKSVADLTALMADPTFQATAAQNPQLAKAIVDRSLDVAGLKNGFLGDLWAKLSGGATNDDMTRAALKNYFDSISATASNSIAYDTIDRDAYGHPGTVSPLPSPNNSNSNQSAASATNVNSPAGTTAVASQPNKASQSNQKPINPNAERQGAQLLQASQGTPVTNQSTPSTQTAPASKGTTTPSSNGYLRDTNHEGPVTISPNYRSDYSALRDYQQGTALAGTGASSSSTSGQSPVSPEQARKIIVDQAAQQGVDLKNAQALPNSMMPDYVNWYITTQNKGQPVNKPAELATNNPTFVAQYLASKGYSEDKITSLMQATLSGQTGSSTSQTSAQASKQPVPVTPPTPSTSQAAPQQDTATQGTPNSFPTYADRQLASKVGTYSPKLDAVLNSSAGRKVMSDISTTGAVDLSSPQTRAVLQKATYLAVPAIVQNIRNLPPEELQHRWQNAVAIAQNMSIDAAEATGQLGLSKAKQVEQGYQTQEDVARLAYLGDLARLAAAQAAQSNNPDAGRLKAVADILNNTLIGTNSTIAGIFEAAKQEGLSVAEFLKRNPNLKQQYDEAQIARSTTLASSTKLLTEFTGAKGSVIPTEPGKTGLSVIIPWAPANALYPSRPAVYGQSGLSEHNQSIYDSIMNGSKR